MTISLDGRVAIVTGAGTGLGRAHAQALAAYGARVVVNDLDAVQAQTVADQIVAAGGEAIGYAASVTDMEAVTTMVARTIVLWGAVDILVNNAGILRDKSFAKMDLADFRLVLDVHLMGSVNCTKAVWDHMRARHYGRILFTTSSSGLYGNFGQANYGAAKMALVGLMQTLAIEGARNNIRVNCLAPSASTQMTEGLYPGDALASLGPDLVSPAVVALTAEHAPTRRILLAGGGSFEQANITMTRGLYLGASQDITGDLCAQLDAIANREGESVPTSGNEQYQYEASRAAMPKLSATQRSYPSVIP